jgi:sugar/nucleoside kinase (ribokinase family)
VNIIFLGKEGTRISAYYTGDPVAWRESLGVRETAWFYASGYGQVGCEDLEALIEVFQASRSRGVNVAFDPGPWFFAAATHEQMLRAWRWTDCLIGTESELGTWRTYSGVQDLIRQTLREGPEHVVVKRGEKGAAFGSHGDRVASMGTEGVFGANTVGAGDTFNAGVIHGLCNGATLEASVKLGLELSTRAVRRGRGVLGAFEDS